ncbi:MAG: hypothetical protein ACXVJH_15425, partial [Acidimicrobiia bacterium]
MTDRAPAALASRILITGASAAATFAIVSALALRGPTAVGANAPTGSTVVTTAPAAGVSSTPAGAPAA